MTKVKDGFWKALGSKIGNNDYLLKAGGGYVGVGNSSGNVPISNGTVNTNLNADKIDGYHYNNLPYLPISGGTLSGPLYLSWSTNNIMDNTTTNPRIIFSESGSQSVGLVYTDYDSYRSSKGLKVMDLDGSDIGNVWFEVQGYIYSSGFVKNNSSDSYVLLGGGGHKLESNLSVNNSLLLNGYTYDEVRQNTEYRTMMVYPNTSAGLNQTSAFWMKCINLSSLIYGGGNRIHVTFKSNNGADVPAIITCEILRTYQDEQTGDYNGWLITQHESLFYGGGSGSVSRIIIDQSHYLWIYYDGVWPNQNQSIQIIIRSDTPLSLLSLSDAKSSLTTTTPTPCDSSADFTFSKLPMIINTNRGYIKAKEITSNTLKK